MVQITIENGDLGLNVRNAINNMFAELYASAGGVSVPGSDTQILFNDGGALGADAGFTFDKTTGRLYIKPSGSTATPLSPIDYPTALTIDCTSETEFVNSMQYVGNYSKVINSISDSGMFYDVYNAADDSYLCGFGINTIEGFLFSDIDGNQVQLFTTYDPVESLPSIGIRLRETGHAPWLEIRPFGIHIRDGATLSSYGTGGFFQTSDDGTSSTGYYFANNFTDWENYEEGFISWRDNAFCIGTEYYGAGVQRLIRLINLPTSDPAVADALWNNAGVLTISAG